MAFGKAYLTCERTPRVIHRRVFFLLSPDLATSGMGLTDQVAPAGQGWPRRSRRGRPRRSGEVVPAGQGWPLRSHRGRSLPPAEAGGAGRATLAGAGRASPAGWDDIGGEERANLLEGRRRPRQAGRCTTLLGWSSPRPPRPGDAGEGAGAPEILFAHSSSPAWRPRPPTALLRRGVRPRGHWERRAWGAGRRRPGVEGRLALAGGSAGEAPLGWRAATCEPVELFANVCGQEMMNRKKKELVCI